MMVIDFEKVDRLFEVGRITGSQIHWCIFDKRALLPLPQLVQAVSNETSESISEAELRMLAGLGWFPLLKGAGLDGSEEGSPLYVPSRIGFLLKLQRRGYTTDELRLIAHFEECMIDDVLTTEESAYLDDDLETLLLYARGRLYALEHGTKTDANGVQLDQTAEADLVRRELKFVQDLQANGIPERRREAIAKRAFRVRALNEMIRIHLLESDRGKIDAGYGPFVVCSSHSWSKAEGFKAGPINWRWTVESAIAYGDGSDTPPIRVPGFLLQGDRVIPTRTLRPAEYAQQWKDHDLDAYLECWADLRGERRCLNCFAALPEAADERKRFCGEKCRNAAKQRRHRERNPDSVERAQQRYWQSLDS